MRPRTETTLLTVDAPFRYFMSDHTMCRAPRVVGVDADGEILWAPRQTLGRSKLRYSPTRAQEIVTPTDELFHERLVGFFATYLAEGAKGHEKDYNCHLFGRWMVGASLATPENGVDGPDDVIADGVLVAKLEHGQRGVVGGWFNNKTDPAHSLIGLGDDLVLHVDGWQGPMRITSAEDAVQKYVSPFHRYDTTYRAGIYTDTPEPS